MFQQFFVKSFQKPVWVCLYSAVVFWVSTFCFSSSIATSLLSSDLLSHWNTFGCLNTTIFLYIASGSSETSLAQCYHSKALWATKTRSNWWCSLGLATLYWRFFISFGSNIWTWQRACFANYDLIFFLYRHDFMLLSYCLAVCLKVIKLIVDLI